jgi:hypothetical protein
MSKDCIEPVRRSSIAKPPSLSVKCRRRRKPSSVICEWLQI